MELKLLWALLIIEIIKGLWSFVSHANYEMSFEDYDKDHNINCVKSYYCTDYGNCNECTYIEIKE